MMRSPIAHYYRPTTLLVAADTCSSLVLITITSLLLVLSSFSHNCHVRALASSSDEPNSAIVISPSTMSEVKVMERSFGDWILSGLLNDTTSRFLRECTLKHGHHTTDKIKIERKNTKECLEMIFSTDRLGRILSGNQVTGNNEGVVRPTVTSAGAMMTQDVISRLCNDYVDEVELCIRPLWVELKACAESAFDRDLEDLRQAARAALDYVCHDGGRRIVDFVILRGPECLFKGETGRQVVEECLEIRRPLLEQLVENYSIFNPDNCKIQAESNDCIVKVAEKCEGALPTAWTSTNGDSLSDLIRGFADVAMNRTDCAETNDLVTVSSAAATAAGPTFVSCLVLLVIRLLH